MTNHGRRPKLEDNLKILIVEYLSNHWSDHAQILNLSLCDQNQGLQMHKVKIPTMEDDLHWKTTSKYCGISQKPLVRSCSNV